MYDYVIVHGSYGDPFENWFPWLYEKLTSAGKQVLAPQFPCGSGIQNYENWKRVLDAYRYLIDERTTFVGHSLAPAFIVDYLVDNDLKVNDLVFAAPFYGLIDIPDFDEVNSPFFIDCKFEKLERLSNRRICFISKNDPYVPNSLSIEFARKTCSDIIFVEDAGHFNSSAGYRKFDELYEIIK